jgi:hypothetical protein
MVMVVMMVMVMVVMVMVVMVVMVMVVMVVMVVNRDGDGHGAFCMHMHGVRRLGCVHVSGSPPLDPSNPNFF